MRVTTASLVSASLLLGRASATLPPIIMKGSKFFYENGTQFFIKGVAYQQDSAAAGASTGSSKYTDPLADAASCKRDVPYLQGLNTNVIRTYAIDPTKNHDECMALLDAAGIYVISDLSEPSLSINRIDAQWDTELYQRYTSVVDNLSKYSNVIGFFAGNEVTNDNTTTQASAFVKAAVRDTKAYIKANVKRWMGVGYAANDDSDIRANIAHYFNCGDPSDAIDFWGYNIYEWCGENTIQGSGYQDQIDFFKNYSVPVFFAEYGCNKNGGAAGRIFEETTALYSDQMTGDISGGIVYMYFQETNDFGLVSVSGDSVSTLKDYGALKTRIASVKPSATAMTAYNPTNSPAACPPVAPDWQVKGEVLPPTPDASLCECMFSSLSCVPAANLPTKNYTDIFGYICGASPASCVGQSANATTGLYGTYSMCNSTQKLGYVLDQYYKNTKYASDSCNFDGQAVLAKASGAASSCTAALSSASSANAAVATATGGTSSGSSGASSSSNAAVAAGPVRHLFAMGEMAVGLYVFVAMAVGATMVLL